MDYTIWDLPNNEETAIKFLQDKGIIHKERFCSNNHPMKLIISANTKKVNTRWRCGRGGCRETKGLRSETWFEGSRIPILTAVRFIYLWCQELTSGEFCEMQLDMDRSTTVDWNKYMREVCANALMSRQQIKIGGCDKIVELDITIFTRGKKKDNLPPQWVLGGLCRETKECFLVPVIDCSAKTVMTFIEENVADGCIIYSDCWRTYNEEELRDANYEHFAASHNYNFVDPESGSTGCHTVNQLWGSAKWRNKRQRGTARQHLESYLVEFMWRRLHPKTELFTSMMYDICNFMPAA